MDVVKKIEALGSREGRPKKPIKMNKVTVSP